MERKVMTTAYDVLEQKPPSVLYHYTRRAGLLGILASKRAWASSARHMNDASELATAESAAIAVIVETEKTEGRDGRKACKQMRSWLTFLERHEVFVFSLSSEPDVLSQWRAYAAPGNGYAIGFSTEGLRAWIRPCRLVQCVYDQNHQRELIRDAVKFSLDAYRQPTPVPITKATPSTMAHVSFIVAFDNGAIGFKDSRFREEKEWRVITREEHGADSAIKFRDSGNFLVPYVELGTDVAALPIVEVWVGPTPHPELERRTVAGLLQSHNLREARVLNSEIPYRAW